MFMIPLPFHDEWNIQVYVVADEVNDCVVYNITVRLVMCLYLAGPRAL